MIAHPELFWPVVIALAVVVSVHLLAVWRLFCQMPDDPNIADLTDAELAIVEEERIREIGRDEHGTITTNTTGDRDRVRIERRAN